MNKPLAIAQAAGPAAVRPAKKDERHDGVAGRLRPAPADIRLQAQKIVDDPAFPGGPRTRKFLHYIVEEALRGNGSRLKQYTIAVEVFGRDSSFNPDADPIVRLEAGRLRRALEIYYFRDGRTDSVRITVPKGSYVPVFALNEAADGPAAKPLSHASALASACRPDAQRVLILPFGHQPEANECRLFSSGLTDQLTVALARYRDIAVTSGETEADAAGNPISAGTAAKARFVLSGVVRQSEKSLRITGRLHDVESGSIVWTDCFDLDSPVTSSLQTQDRIADYISGIIADYYGVISHTLSLQAVYDPSASWSLQDSIHRHRYLARTLTERVYRLARADLEYGMEHAANHPMIWAALAHTIFYGNVLGFDSDRDWESLVYRYAQRSFELDHKCAFGHVVMGLHQLYHRQFNEVFETCDRILRHNAHAPSTKLSAGFFRALAGDWDAGIAMLTPALGTVLHPPGWAYRVTFLDHFRREAFGCALHEANKYHAPEHLTPSLLRAAALSRLGRLEEARSASAEVKRISPNFADFADRYFAYLVAFDDLGDALKDALRPTGLLV